MRTVVVYKDEADYSRTVDEFIRDFQRQTGHKLTTINPDTSEGTHFCETYGIVQYPTIIALSDESVMQNMWVGLPLPTINEVSYYV